MTATAGAGGPPARRVADRGARRARTTGVRVRLGATEGRHFAFDLPGMSDRRSRARKPNGSTHGGQGRSRRARMTREAAMAVVQAAARGQRVHHIGHVRARAVCHGAARRRRPRPTLPHARRCAGPSSGTAWRASCRLPSPDAPAAPSTSPEPWSQPAESSLFAVRSGGHGIAGVSSCGARLADGKPPKPTAPGKVCCHSCFQPTPSRGRWG